MNRRQFLSGAAATLVVAALPVKAAASDGFALLPPAVASIPSDVRTVARIVAQQYSEPVEGKLVMWNVRDHRQHHLIEFVTDSLDYQHYSFFDVTMDGRVLREVPISVEYGSFTKPIDQLIYLSRTMEYIADTPTVKRIWHHAPAELEGSHLHRLMRGRQ